ncbi:hypothetical protein SAMN05216558_4493 [Pseudomonas vancouverensis]|nr:hypothetical protein SAMN05216558_4493 [Pseudomonas vancouverensis]
MLAIAVCHTALNRLHDAIASMLAPTGDLRQISIGA